MSGTSIVPSNPPESQINYNRIIAWLTGILTLLLALFSFILSFNALTALAQEHGVSIPPLFPFVVEFAVVIFSLNALYRSLSDEPTKVQWVLIIGSSLLAGLFNVVHAQEDAISMLIAAMPSLFLLLSFESFLSLAKHRMTQQGVIQSVAQIRQEYQIVSQNIKNLMAQRDTLQDEVERLKSIRQEQISLDDTIPKPDIGKAQAAKQAQIAVRRQQVLTLTQQGMSQPAMADELGVSLATIKRDTRVLNGQMKESQ